MKRNHSSNKLKVSFPSLSRIETANVLFHSALTAPALEVDARVFDTGLCVDAGSCALQSLLVQVWGGRDFFFPFFRFFFPFLPFFIFFL